MVIENVGIHELVDVVVNILDARDPYTFLHSWRVSELSVLIAEDMRLPEGEIKDTYCSASA